MSKQQYKRKNQAKQGRLEIIAELYKKGYSVRKINAEVKKRLNLRTYSVSTTQSDIKSLLDEWRENRIDDMDDALQLELERIDSTISELWDQWEKSKTDYMKTASKRKGIPVKHGEEKRGEENDDQQQPQNIKTFSVEDKREQVIMLGNPAYIAEIRQQLIERRKLLGLYAPEKKEFTGKITNITQMSDEEIIAEIERLNKVGD